MIALETTGSHWMAAYRAAVILARAGRRALLLDAPLEVRTASGLAWLPTGSLLIDALPSELPAGTPAATEVAPAAEPAGLAITAQRIAVYGGGGAPYNHAAAFAELGFEVDYIFPEAIRAGGLAQVDILVVPGGGNRAMQGQLAPLGEAGTQAINDFVAQGGMYLSSCAGSIAAAFLEGEITELCPEQSAMQLANAGLWNAAGGWLTVQSPGIGVLRAQVAAQHPVTLGLPAEIDITHYNGPLFQPVHNKVAGASALQGLLAVSGVTEAFTAGEDFLTGGGRPAPESLVSRAAREGIFNAVAGTFGAGRVVLFGSHPESGPGALRGDWGEAARMMANAAIWNRAGGVAAGPSYTPPPGASIDAHIRAGLMAGLDKLDPLIAAAQALLRQDASGADWLRPDRAMAMNGQSAAQIWQERLQGVATSAAALRAESDGILAQLDGGTGGAATARARCALAAALHHQTPPEWDIDVGYEGLLQHLDRAAGLLERAAQNFDLGFAPASEPYEHLGVSPYHLAVGSYIAATGILENGLLLLRQHAAALSTAAELDRLGVV